MSDPLAVYLHDHLAGSRFALDLLESLRNRYENDPLGTFAGALLNEVNQDQKVLQQIIDNVGRASFDLKEAAAWFGEKVSRLKIGPGGPADLGTFEALEALQLGIVGKAALWRALAEVSKADLRLAGFDYNLLTARADDQRARVEQKRMEIARAALAPAA